MGKHNVCDTLRRTVRLWTASHSIPEADSDNPGKRVFYEITRKK